MRFRSIVVDPYEGFGDDTPSAPTEAEKEGREAMKRLRERQRPPAKPKGRSAAS